ncbi:MAG: hypothetical protein ABI318_11185, partial [Chthoniobacteraceae bacterium]
MSGFIQNSEFRIQNSPDPVAVALAEDIGGGDLTCAYFVDPARSGKARIFAKQPCILAGVDAAARAFGLVDATLAVRVVSGDGTTLKPGDTALEISGPVRSILTAERTALNFIQQLSG